MVIDHVISGYRQNGPKGSRSLVLHVLTIDILLESSTIKIDRNCSRMVSESDQEIPQSQFTDNPVAPRGRAAQPSRDTRKTN